MARLRFSIRDLLWLTALCAVLAAWWIEHRRTTSESRASKAAAMNYQLQTERLKAELADGRLESILSRTEKMDLTPGPGDSWPGKR
jgi:hypothetical protein